MKFSNTLSDTATLEELGTRIAQCRLNRNMTQKALAREAGVSHPTVARIEAGESSQVTNLIRLIRALGLLENLDMLLPQAPASPIQQLKMKGKTRQRASSKKNKDDTNDTATLPWSWDLPEGKTAEEDR